MKSVIQELQKVKNENQDTMEYEAYTKAFDKKKEAKICFQAASNGSFNDFERSSSEYSEQAKKKSLISRSFCRS